MVTVNYRLGIFGYFGLPRLAGSGTFGLQDQVADLAWVRRNAASFGGDPGNVTVAGRSAGAMSACSLLASPAAAGLFAKVIMQSGSCLADYPANATQPGDRASSPWIARTQLEAAGSHLAADLGCGSAADVPGCLRARPTAELLAHTNDFRRIAYDTPTLPERPAAALRDRRVAALPVLSGGTRDEARLFAAAFYRDGMPIDGARYRDLLADSFGPAADEVGRRYPVSAYGNAALAWTRIITDTAWACPTLAANRLLAGRGPTYAYEFADRDAFPLFDPPPDFPTGAFHSSDLGYLFDFPGFALPLSPEQQILSERMIGYWTRFAHTGSPNGPDLPPLPRFSPDGSRVPALAPGPAGIRPVDVWAEHRCSFWNPGG